MFVSCNSQQNIQNASVRNYSQSAEDILKQLTLSTNRNYNFRNKHFAKLKLKELNGNGKYLNRKLFSESVLRRWQTKKHCCENIVAHDVSMRAQTGKHLLRTQNVSEQNQKHFCFPDTKFVSAKNGETFVSAKCVRLVC